MKMPRQAVSYVASLKSCGLVDVDYDGDSLSQISRQFELECVSGFVLLAGKLGESSYFAGMWCLGRELEQGARRRGEGSSMNVEDIRVKKT